MVRAAYTDVVKRFPSGEYPGAWTQARVTDLCSEADYILDAYTSPQTLSTTSDEAISISVDVVIRLMIQGQMLEQSSGTMGHNGRQYPLNMEILTPELRTRIENLLRTSTVVDTLDMIDESDV